MSKNRIFWLGTVIVVFFGLYLWLSDFFAESKPETVIKPVEEEEVIVEPETEIILLAVGDIMLARKVERLMSEYGREYPFLEVESRLNQADLTFGNLECAVSTRGTPLPGKGIWLRANPEVMPQLKECGFDVLSIANNHSLDYDAEAFLDTLKWLREFNIAPVGGGEDIIASRTPFITTVNDIRIGFLAYTEMADMFWSYDYPRKLKATESQPGVAPFEYDIIIEDVKSLKEQVDLLVLSLHWGTEYSLSPTEIQRQQARGLVDAGADVIVGHHPHVVQGVEIYNKGIIAYSLGNFIFDQNWLQHTREGLVMEIKLKSSGISEVKLLPVIIRESQPRFEQEEWAKKLADSVCQYSSALGTRCLISENPLEVILITDGEYKQQD